MTMFCYINELIESIQTHPITRLNGRRSDLAGRAGLLTDDHDVDVGQNTAMIVGGLALVDSAVISSGIVKHQSVIKHSPVGHWVIYQHTTRTTECLYLENLQLLSQLLHCTTVMF